MNENSQIALSFRDYLITNGVTCSVVEFAKFKGKTPDTLRKNYKHKPHLIDAYIKDWRESK